MMDGSSEKEAAGTLPGGQLARLPGGSREAAVHEQMYRYAEDLQRMLERNRTLEDDNAALKDACQRLSERQDSVDTLIERSADMHIVTDPEGRVLHCNPASSMLARPQRLTGTALRSWVAVAYRSNFDTLQQHALRSTTGRDEWELRLQREESGLPPLIVSANAMPVKRDGKICQLHWILRDITQLRETQFESRIASMVFKSTSEGVMITDVDGEILAVNPAFSQITGYAAEEVIGRQPSMLRSGMHDSTFYTDFWRRLRESGSWQGEIYNRRKNGEVYPEWLSVNTAHDGDGNVLSYIAVFTDLSRILQAERRLAYLAHHDMLTGLPNRLLFNDRLEQTLAQARRTNIPFTLIFVDLDRFKQINDTLGHEVGDIVLKEAAARLSHSVRESDTVARLGGDEFVIIAPELTGNEVIGRLCDKLIEALSAVIEINEHKLVIGGSLGCATWPSHGTDATSLLNHADSAMYRAKSAGGNAYAIHDDSGRNELSALLIETELRQAIGKGQLRLEYQPQVAADSGDLLGVEALLRWDHPELGAVPPLQFIPVAERTGLILPIGEWVLTNACAQLAEWDRQGLPVLSLAVNLSPRQLRAPDLVEAVRTALAASGIAAERLELEVTETELMNHLDADYRALEPLRALGIRLAIDDFGSGYSSLGRLMNLPIDSLKLDRSFISELENEAGARAAAITAAIVSMGRALGTELIAEGVETEHQYALLVGQGCQIIQGYLTGRPMRPEALAGWLRDKKPAAELCVAGEG